MKNIYLLSNPAKTSTHFRFDSLSILSRQSVLPILFVFLTAFSLHAWGDAAIAYTLTPASGSNNSYAGNCDIVINGITWNLTGNSTVQPWRIGGKSLSDEDRELYSKTAITDDIDSISIEHGAASSITVNSMTVKISKLANFSTLDTTISVPFASNTTTVIKLKKRSGGKDWSDCYYKIIYNVSVSGTSNKFIEFKNAIFYKTTAPACDDKVTISKSSDPLPTGCSFALNHEGATSTCSAVTLTITPTCATHYHVVSVTESNSRSVTNNGDGTWSVSYAANATGSSIISVTFAEDTKHTVTFQNNGVTLASGGTREVYDGEEIGTLPVLTDGDACDLTSTTFMGWTESVISDKTDDAPTMISASTTISTDKTYNAVWAEKHTGSKTPGTPVAYTGGGKDDLVALSGVSASGLGSDYSSHSPYEVRFDDTGDYIQFDLDYAPTEISFEYKMVGGNSSSKVTIKECATADGTYTDVEEFTISGAQNSTGTKTTSESFSQRFVRMVFTKGSNVGIGPITVTGFIGSGTTYSDYITDCGVGCSTPTLTFDAATINKFMGDAVFKNNLTVTGNDLGATLTYTSSNTAKAEIDADGNVTIKDAMSTEPITITASLAKKTVGMDCQKAVKATYTLNIYNKVTWSVNGAAYTAGDPTQQAVEGGTITAYPTDPDGSTVCGGKTFVGWTTAAIDIPQATAPATLYTSLASMSSVHITENTTYYAVFVDQSGDPDVYRKGTLSDLTNGQSTVIVNPAASQAMSNSGSGGTLSALAVSFNGAGKIESPFASVRWTVEKDGDRYKFKNGHYAYVYSTTYLYCDDDDEIYTDYWTITASGSNYVLYSNRSTSSYYLECYNDYFKLYGAATSGYFLMDFYVPDVTYSDYTTSCGPVIKANEVEFLTSTKDQIVKSQAITIKGSSLTGGTLSVKSITGDASQFACVLASQTITAGAIETTYTISYTPTVSGTTHTAEIIFWDGTTESDPITLRGRSLPEHFAIVAYDGANYYALDGSMSGTASTVRAIPVTVTAGVVDYCPSRGIYSLTDLDTPDQNVHLTSATGRLYGEGSGTGLNIHSFTSLSGTGWLLTTTDFVNYHVTNATTTTRGIMYNSTYDVMGHYNTTNYGKANYFGEIQFLPYADVCTCLDAPQNVVVVAKATRATITWDEVADATGYEVICLNASTSAPEGSISVDATNRTATITSLTNQTNYNFTVKAVAVGSDCSLAHAGHFRTTNCDDVPYGIRVTPAINSATFKWSMEAASATIKIFSDEECTAQVGSDHTGLTSPATITGLADNTQYYAKILAGGTCESGVIDFQTNSPSVEIAEWFPDSIRIIIDANADASVTIEDKQEHGSSTTNYADKLFISKYFEADGNNKMIAIFNGTPDTIDITNIWLYRSELGASEKKICLKNFGKVPGKIAPNEEIIIMRYTSDTDAAKDCAEKEDNYDEWNIIPASPTSQQLDGEGNNIYTWLQFSGPQSIGLYDNNTGVKKFIDIIGACTNNTGTGELVQIKASNKTSCTYTENSNNDGSGFFANGKDIRYGNDIVLSTNRCLLIRKNTVKSGDDAVANNVYATQEACDASIGHAFTTLGDEWMGFIIGAGAHAADSTCVGLAYVGGFDYNGYYTTYDSIGGIKDLTGQQNDDGTYTISIPQLDTLACTTMRIKVYEGTEVKAQREYQVPIMVDTDKEWLTTDTIFINDNPNQLRTYNTCKKCDVVILKGATLTKAVHAGNDVDSIGNLTIYPGGTMNIPTSRTFNVASVQFRVEGENVPFIKLAGTLETADKQVLVSRRIDNSDAYFFSLPYDCNISDIRWSNGVPAVLDDGFRIKEYDSRARADEGSTKGTPGHWKMVTGSTLEAGKGYQISVNSKYLKELIFPLEINTTNVSDAENEKAPHHDNDVAIHQYTNGATTINNHNWNFIAQPYLCAMSPMAGDAITYGYLEYEIEEVAGEQQVVWYRRMEGNQYLTIYNPSTRTYDQKFWSSVTQLDPFLAFFVQGKTEGSFTFTEGNRKNNAPARHLASQAEVDEDPSIFVGVTLSGNGLTDQANLRVRQDFTEDEYKLGYDLLKFTTYYKDRPQVYMKTPSYQLAFQAVSDSVAKNTWLPMGVYCYKPGTYTFGLSNDYPIDEVEAVYLYDKVTGVTTNLLYDTYSVTTSSQLYTNNRFALNVIVNRREPQVTTDTGLPEAPDNMVRKILINGHVYIQRGAAIYDITGKQMLNF